MRGWRKAIKWKRRRNEYRVAQKNKIRQRKRGEEKRRRG